jgi:hypothetical protein
MRNIIKALAVLALASLAKAVFPSVAHASGGGYYAIVCCGNACAPVDYCSGYGPYFCCR